MTPRRRAPRRHAPRRRAPRLLAVLVMLACTALTPAAPAPAAPDEGGLRLVAQSPWVALRQVFFLQLALDDPAVAAQPGATVTVRVHQSVSTRTAFDEVIAKNDAGRVLFEAPPTPIGDVPRLDGNLLIAFGLAGSDETPTLNVTQPGVYPVEVTLTNTGVPADPLITWLVVVDPDRGGAKPLLLSWIWQLGADPVQRTDNGAPADPAFSAEVAPDGRLDRIATVAYEATRFPASLLIGPETVDAWARLAETDPVAAPGLQRLRSATSRAGAGVLAAPYVPIDIPSLETSGLGDRAPGQYVQGSETLQAVLGTTTARPDTVFVERTNEVTTGRLREMLMTQLALPAASLVPAPQKFTPAQSFALDSPAGRSRGVATAPYIEALLEGDASPALKAQRVVAALAEVAYETPATDRGLVMSTPPRWDPDVATVRAVLGALDGFPLVEPAALPTLFTKVSAERVDGREVVRTNVPFTPDPAGVTPAEVDFTSARLQAYAEVAGEEDPIVVEGRKRILVSMSSAVSPERAREELRAVETSVEAFTDAIGVEAKRITLTAQKASVPLSFQNRVNPARPVRVRVRLSSPKLSFPDGSEQVVTLEPGNTTLQVAVEARASGTFPMRIVLTSEDGALRYGEPELVTVRSTTFGGFGGFLTVGALVFLAAWWANHFLRGRRKRRAAAPAP